MSLYHDMLGAMNRKTATTTHGLSVDDLGHMARILKLLAHPHRLQIIGILERTEAAPVHELVKELGLSQGATSGHLSLMRQVGLVESERRGKEVWYHLGDRRALSILHCMCNKKGT